MGPDGSLGMSYEIHVTLVAFTSSISDVGFPCPFFYWPSVMAFLKTKI